jgi:hypothetical protein
MMRWFSVAAFAALVVFGVPSARAQSRVQAGLLDCDISGGFGMIIASRKEVTCVFTPAGGGLRETYIGTISKFGLDLGATSGGQMLWSVYAPTTLRRGALAGAYVGASAEATVAAGLGANVLVGGSGRTVALQPVSLQGQSGLNVAAGVTELRLAPAR